MCNLAGDDGGRASDRDHGGDGQGQGGGEGGQLHNLGRGINKPGILYAIISNINLLIVQCKIQDFSSRFDGQLT